MTDITPEQRAAVEWVRRAADEDPAARTLLDLLPAELTNPQPELPTEPGAYLSPLNVTIVLTEEGDWMHGDVPVAEATARAMLPLTRLVPERPTITREDIRLALIQGRYLSDQVDAILALVNGKGAES